MGSVIQLMKTPAFTSLLLIIALGFSPLASADHYRHDHRYDNHGRYERHERYGGNHHHHDRGNRWGNVAAAAIVLGAIGIAGYQAYNQPEPVYVAPPPQQPVYLQPQPAAQFWYFCASSRQYYPYVRYCPEGWQPVQP